MKTFSIYNNDQKEIYLNGFMLNVTDWCVISPATGEGAFLPSGTLYMFLWHESEAQGLSRMSNVPSPLLE